MQPDPRSSAIPFLMIFVLATVIIIAFVQPSRRSRAEAEKSEAAGARAKTAKQRVVLVSVDGMHIAIAAAMPTVQQLFADGAGTYQAKVPLGSTTAISHAVLFTGADPKVNGVTTEPTGQGRHGVKFRWTPLKVKDTLFTAVEAAGYKAVAAVQKGKLVGMLRPDGDETGVISTNDAKKVVKTACDAMQDDDIRLVILHFKMIDDAGHRHHWLSDEQAVEAAKIDGELEQVCDCVDQANRDGDVETTLIVTADHGGTPGGSHGSDNDDNRLVPWVAVGPGIKSGYAIEGRDDLHATKHVSKPAILLVDTAPTILSILGLSASSISTLSPDAKSIDDIFIQP